ncbi:PAS domain S-box protein [Aquabacterium lacunae]|uniref:histidine kinase n=1 Tax=Aquabacterium lacunae TaxID=2528630 RepID=A0A4Q9H3H9_9BURK|nr:PAS domain-containing protein [Aquabacterium lacunae]TBO32405.1 PAS domain S-box protein [Aquabacterium lacunae]
MNTASPVGPQDILESERLATLVALKWLDASAPASLESLVRLAARLTDCPVACVNLVDAHRLYALASHGLGQKHATRTGSWCDQTIRGNGLHMTHGQSTDRWKLYAGVPIGLDKLHVATLCVMDDRARALTEAQQQSLQDLARVVQGAFEARLEFRRLRRESARVRGATTAGSDWLWETDADGRLQWLSASLRHHTGLDPIAEMGMSAKDIYSPCTYDHGASWQRYQQARLQRQAFSDALAERDTPRGRMIVSISGAPVFSKDGRFMGYRGASRNVTRQIELEARARQRDALLREAIESFHAGVMISSPDGTILMANHHWLHSVGARNVDELPRWPDLLRRLISEGHYPDAVGRETEFYQWRMALHQENRSQVIRLRERVILSRDHLLRDGNLLHFSTDITQSHAESEALAGQQKALQASEARLKAVLQALPDLWFVVDEQGRYLDAHRQHPMLLRPFDELVGRPFGSALNPDQAAVEQDALHKAHVTGQSQRIEYSVTTRDGVLRHFEGRMSPMPGGQTLFITRDMTDLRALERDIRTLQQVLQADLTLGLVVMDATQSDHTVLYATPGAQALLHVKNGSLMGRPALDCLRPLGPNEAGLQLLAQSMQAGLPCMAMLTARNPDRDDERTLEVRLTPLKNTQSQRTHLVALLHDVTDRQRAAERLRLSEERWKFALEGAGDGVWDWDLGSNRTYFSARCMALLGETEREFRDDPNLLRSCLHPEDLPQIDAAFAEYRQRGHGVLQAECRLKPSADREETWLLVRGKVMARGPDGQASRLVGTLSDITQLKQAERALRDKQAAEQASRAKSEFLSRMSHELRTPLNAVKGFAQLILQMPLKSPLGDSADKVRSHAERIVHSSESLQELVDEVLDLQRIESGSVNLRPDWVGVRPLLDHVAEMLMPMADRFQVKIQVEDTAIKAVHTDGTRLRQILTNLASNAIKYNRPQGRVTLSAKQLDRQNVRFNVEDTGMGMSPDQIDRLFQPFERLGRDTTSIEGSGLGLVIAKSLTEALGGNISIRSELDTGTCIAFTVPHQADQVVPDLPAQDPRTALAGVGATTSPPVAMPACLPLRVLYVEDNRLNAMLFEEALRGHDCLHLEVAEDGQEAMVLAQDFVPQVLVIDAHLPGMTGFDVLHALRKLPALRDVPAYMCSADAMPEDIAKAHQQGFVGYWTKPVDLPAVISTLHALADQLATRGDN